MAKWVRDLKVGTVFYFKCKDPSASGFMIKKSDVLGGCECLRIRDNKMVALAYCAVVTPC